MSLRTSAPAATSSSPSPGPLTIGYQVYRDGHLVGFADAPNAATAISETVAQFGGPASKYRAQIFSTACDWRRIEDGNPDFDTWHTYFLGLSLEVECPRQGGAMDHPDAKASWRIDRLRAPHERARPVDVGQSRSRDVAMFTAASRAHDIVSEAGA